MAPGTGTTQERYVARLVMLVDPSRARRARAVPPGPALLGTIPIVVVAAYAALLLAPSTRRLALFGVGENRPVEIATLALFVVAAWIAGRLGVRARGNGDRPLVWGFWLLFGAGMFAVGMEEIAWGQSLLGFPTPEGLRDINTQGEVTLHNLNVFRDHLEAFPLVYGLGGLIGVLLARRPAWAPIAPPRVLTTWFVVIAVMSGVDLFQDFVVVHPRFDLLVNDLDEVVEMLVAASAALYVWLRWGDARPPERPAPAVARKWNVF